MASSITQDLQDSLGNLPTASEKASQIRHLAELVDSDVPLQSFLEQLLPLLCRLFDAHAAVSWMNAGAADAVFGVRYQMDNVVQTIDQQKQHERLVQLAWRQNRALLAEPTYQPTNAHADPVDTTDAFENPTQFPLLFGPIMHGGKPIALLEIVLEPRSESLTGDQKQQYLRSVQLVAQRVYGGLKQRMTLPTSSMEQVLGIIDGLRTDVRAMQLQTQKMIENRLQQFEGTRFDNIAENQSFAKLVHQLLDSYGLRVQCPECGNPAILRCLRAGNAKLGAFVFDHYLESGRTFHGGLTTVPVLKIVPKPARRTAKS